MMTDDRNRPANRQPIPVLFEDNHVLVVIKPANMPTQEDESGDLDLLTALKEDLKVRHQKPGNVFLGLVHRLDRPVSGVMVFAKTSKAASRLSDQVRSGSLGKIYTAVVHGTPSAAQDRLVHHLLKDAKTNTVASVAKGTSGAKEAILEYRLLRTFEAFSLVRVRLFTGRSHQIRVQFATIGCPLYGDQKYGARVNKPGQQIALHSTELSFEHPTLKETMTFRSLPPRVSPWNHWDEDRLGLS